jgi:hypothetical protein
MGAAEILKVLLGNESSRLKKDSTVPQTILSHSRIPKRALQMREEQYVESQEIIQGNEEKANT